MYDNKRFQQLVAAHHSTGEVMGVNRFLMTVKGLDGAAVGGLVLFENGHRGIVREVLRDSVVVLNLESEKAAPGTFVVLEDNEFKVPVGEGLIGRVVSPLGQPLDGKGPLQFEGDWPIYHEAPALTERHVLKEQLASGVTMVDMLFPIVLGQRIAILGDTKSGKTSFLLQLGDSQVETGRVMVYVLIGKRRVEVEQVVAHLNASGAMASSIVIVANIFDSLAQSYLAPYIGCAVAEYLWHHKNRDVVIVYDDLSAHAKVYREVALQAGVNPGRDSYPGDMFYAHSSLLERAGKLAKNDRTLTALPVVLTPGDDITAFLPTSVMSITDGQIIFDLKTFRQNIRPAVNAGLSVSRVGGRAQSERQKSLAGTLFKQLAQYRQAAEFAHFGSDLSQESKQALQLGRLVNQVFHQSPNEIFSVVEQQLMLETVLASSGQRTLNIDLLKRQAKELAPKVEEDSDFDRIVPQLLETVVMGASK